MQRLPKKSASRKLPDGLRTRGQDSAARSKSRHAQLGEEHRGVDGHHHSHNGHDDLAHPPAFVPLRRHGQRGVHAARDLARVVGLEGIGVVGVQRQPGHREGLPRCQWRVGRHRQGVGVGNAPPQAGVAHLVGRTDCGTRAWGLGCVL
jgi:hypothetical protein